MDLAELEAVLPENADLDAVLAEEDLDEESPARAGSPMMMAEVATLELALEAAQDTALLLGALRDSVDMPESHTVLPASIPQNMAVLPEDADLDAVLAEEDLDEESPARAGSP